MAALRATAPTSLRVGSSTVRATVPAGTTGTAVLSSPAIAGWTCNDRPATPYLGLVSVPVTPGTTTITCTFRPPGLLPGTAVAATALLLLGAFLAAQRRRRPRTGRPDVPGAREADACAEPAATRA